MRTPTEIAAEARTLIDTSSRAFVPPSLARIGDLSVEFMEAAAAAFDEVRAELATLRAPVPAPADATA